ncbi:alkaline-phosphatase-like protein [Phlyctochytrium arcticum]|nr:alkaline-phosphatase-like protein [Phlyctochytrium arcticum]
MARGGWHGVIRPSFPSITFPNHYTIVTGLYPQSHGIVANIFYDPTFNDTFVYVDNSKNTQAKWWGGEPIWNTVIKQGYKSASCMWPGSEAPIQGMRPTYWFPYKGSVSPKSRIDHVLAWLDLPVQDRPLLSTVYISNVDTAGHYFGTNSSQVEEALTVVDGALAYLVGEIARRGMEQDVNVVVVSDHGMADGSPQRLLALDKLIDISKVKIIDNLPMIYVYPNSDADTDPNYATLEAASKDPNWHFKVWKREAAPSQFHYSDNMRIGPIVLLPDVGWMFITNSSIPEHVPGIHGYDPAEPSMHAIFVAHGPRFEGGRNLGDFENVGIYNLLSRVMGMQPAPNNGTDWGTKLLAQVSD